MGNELSSESDGENDPQRDWFLIRYREKQYIDPGVVEIIKRKIGPFKNLSDAKKIVEERNLVVIDPGVKIEKKYTTKKNYL